MTRAIRSLIRFERRATQYARMVQNTMRECAGLIFGYIDRVKRKGMMGKPITGYTRIISCKPPRAVKSYSLVMREFAAE